MIGVSWLYVLTLYLQQVLGRSPLATGLLFIPMTIASMLAAPIAGRLASSLGIYRTAASGLIVLAGGLALILTGMSGRGSLSMLVAGMMIGEAGFMLASVALIAAATTAVPETRAGLTAGVVNTASQLGNGVGLAVAAVIGAALPTSHTADHTRYIRALQWGLVICASTLLVLLGPTARPARPTTAESRPHVELLQWNGPTRQPCRKRSFRDCEFRGPSSVCPSDAAGSLMRMVRI